MEEESLSQDHQSPIMSMREFFAPQLESRRSVSITSIQSRDESQPNTPSGSTDMRCPWTLVAIHWVDAYDSENGWVEIERYKPTPTTVISVGYLWPDCLEGYVSITGSWMPDEVDDMKTVGMVTHIPAGMVKQIKILEQPKFD